MPYKFFQSKLFLTGFVGLKNKVNNHGVYSQEKLI